MIGNILSKEKGAALRLGKIIRGLQAADTGVTRSNGVNLIDLLR
jgi:hypothetical protein